MGPDPRPDLRPGTASGRTRDRRPRGPVLPVGLALLGLLAVGGCGESSQARPGRGTGAERLPVRVTTAVVEGRRVQRTVETVGSLLAWEEAIVRSQVAGTVERLAADLGDRVQAGQLLAALDRREADLAVAQLTADLDAARANLARAQAAVDAARASLERVQESRRALVAEVDRARAEAEWGDLELARTRELAARDLIAARDVDNARTRAEVARALLRAAEAALGQHAEQVRAAEAQLQVEVRAAAAAEATVRQREAALDLGRKRLGDTAVRAPLAGWVARRHVGPGEFVRDNTALFTLVATDPLKYAGTVPERVAPELRTGQEVRLQVDAYPGRAFAGRLTRIAPAVDVATRTLAIEAQVPNAEGLLRPGFFARGAVLTREEADVPFVPAEAVAYFVGITKVFVVRDGKVEERRVRAGLREAGWVEIPEGVRPGETVATSALSHLYDGAPVEVAPRPGVPPPADGTGRPAEPGGPAPAGDRPVPRPPAPPAPARSGAAP